ncbi:origin recognition complex subunit 3 isoform X3 [Callorhinchus milii]|uniref:origin recognition complex subunit 3 isoform X3 n=1 Tax=Callorhinchus milii TaxID=7868 RepID=UPI00045753E1|nr:origin recognition complex subunit 3 isoform X3 [Callorhinchus milii]|eukprot:gi/632973671/ref/XP_007903266.1/ PREDICTED: origin recognition complex subunit 3 isoform X2 [Callorhinchus milii]
MATSSVSTSSVSTGCFVFKPKGSKKRAPTLTAEFFNKGKAVSENVRVRFATYESLWQQTKEEIEALQDNLNKKMFGSLLSFIKNSHSDLQSKSKSWSYQMRCSEIPTAALVLGVNVPDHEMTFQKLSDLLQESLTPYVVCLQGKDFTAVKQVLQTVLVHLIGRRVYDDEDEEDVFSVDFSQKKIFCSMASLCGWYRAETQKPTFSSPGKKRKSSSPQYEQSPPVVIIFKDLESFLPKVLQDFLVICSNYIQQLPLILIFGIATSSVALHRMLPQSVSSLLCIELFQSLSCTEHLAAVIDKLSLLEHFYSQPLSLLCCALNEANARVQDLTHDDCELIRQVPSFMRYVESQDPEKQVELLTKDHYLKDTVRKLLNDLHVYHENYLPVLKCLHILTTSLPKYPLGKQIRDLHSTCLEKEVWETEDYSSAFQLFGMMAKDELVSLLTRCLDVLKSSEQDNLEDSVQKLEELLTRFQNLDSVPRVEAVREGEEEATTTQKSLQRKTNLYQLQKELMERKTSRRSKKLSGFEVLRVEVLQFIDKLIRDYLLPPETQPLHEVTYFSAASTLRRHLNAAPRNALQTALNNPYYYLQNEILKSETGTIPNTAPDICIVYKLHLECGRLINLYDWLQAFAMVVNAAEGNDPDTQVGKPVDKILHARFIRAVSELEFLGFVKPTKRKTDHVARLTWGGC